MVRKERLELSRVAPLASKTSASADSATFAEFANFNTDWVVAGKWRKAG